MEIVDIKTHVLLDPGYDRGATSSAQDTIVVEVITDEGLVGVGETDLNAWVARAFIEAPATHTMDRGLKEQLIGRDPLDPEAIWEDLYVGTAMTGRRGGGINAIGALDIAVWDICGHAAGKPCWQLWSEDGRESLTPYASLQPEVTSFGAYTDAMVGWGLRAKELGFRAAKCEATFSGPYVHKGLHGNDAKIIDVVTAVREAVGPEMALMVDVQVRVRLGRPRAALSRRARGARRVLPRDAVVGRRSRGLRGATGADLGAHRPGRVALDAA